jgi:hypothetical protein
MATNANALTQRFPNLEGKVHPDVIQAIRLLYNGLDDHNQAFSAMAAKAQLVATVNSGAVTAVDVVSGGKYSQTPSVSAVGGGGSGASFRVTLNTQTGAIRSVTIISGGSDYTSAPSLVVS